MYKATWNFKSELTFVICQNLYFSHFTLKYPLQNQYNTRMCHIIGSVDFFSQIVLFPFLLFNPRIVNEKATDK